MSEVTREQVEEIRKRGAVDPAWLTTDETKIQTLLAFIDQQTTAIERHAGTIAEYKKLCDEQAAEIVALSTFKKWVHTFLDDKGIPEDPDPEERERTGCRIGCRMRYVFAEIERLTGLLRELKKDNECINSAAKIPEVVTEITHQVRAKLADLDTAQPAPVVRGKRLVWVQIGERLWVAEGISGKIEIEYLYQAYRLFRIKSEKVKFKSLEAAKSAAQQWHDEQLMKWVDTAQATGGAVGEDTTSEESTDD